MGMPILGLSFIYGYNISVIHNIQHPDSTFKKNSNSICYHAIREYMSMKESLTGHVPSVDNSKDICTKVVPGGAKPNHLMCKVLHDLYEQ